MIAGIWKTLTRYVITNQIAVSRLIKDFHWTGA